MSFWTWLSQLIGKRPDSLDIREYRTRNIFVPGGQPEFTYVERANPEFEKDLLAAKDNLCKLVTVTGPTKSGKSVLTKKIYPESESIWIDGGSIKTEDDLWGQVLNNLDEYTGSTWSTQLTSVRGATAEVSGEVGIPHILKTGTKTTIHNNDSESSGISKTRALSMRSAAIQALQSRKVPLIIDDFHYLEAQLQGEVVRALKAPIFKGVPCIILAIPHKRYDAVLVEREMTARVQQISIPYWTRQELELIPKLGLPLLNLTVPPEISELFINEALGSPHLVQEFFRELCLDAGFESTSPTPQVAKTRGSAKDLLSKIAADMSKPVFETLARGPRQRSDRMKRKFRDGRQGDIYMAVLCAIAELDPGKKALDYEEIRGKLRELLENLPQMHEVTRVLDFMSSLQISSSSSAPVLDWDKATRRLHITDPYFGFFLRWGADLLHNEVGTNDKRLPGIASVPPSQ